MEVEEHARAIGVYTIWMDQQSSRREFRSLESSNLNTRIIVKTLLDEKNMSNQGVTKSMLG